MNVDCRLSDLNVILETRPFLTTKCGEDTKKLFILLGEQYFQRKKFKLWKQLASFQTTVVTNIEIVSKRLSAEAMAACALGFIFDKIVAEAAQQFVLFFCESFFFQSLYVFHKSMFAIKRSPFFATAFISLS